MLGAFLAMHGYEVTFAHNGAEALQRIASDRPDLILSDVMMPIMDGVEMGRRLSQHASYGTIPLVFITALPGWRIAADCRHAAYLRKPLDLDLLLDTLSRLLRRQPASREQSVLPER
jgi:CheY-like chemotaxis protein